MPACCARALATEWSSRKVRIMHHSRANLCLSYQTLSGTLCQHPSHSSFCLPRHRSTLQRQARNRRSYLDSQCRTRSAPTLHVTNRTADIILAPGNFMVNLSLTKADGSTSFNVSRPVRYILFPVLRSSSKLILGNTGLTRIPFPHQSRHLLTITSLILSFP